MGVECPPCNLPTTLEERGPVEDPTILLTGTAHFGDVAVQVVAVRINTALRWMPDYKNDVEQSCYQEGGLNVALETVLEELENIGSELEDAIGESRPRTINLATGKYVIWTMPSSFQMIE